MKHDNQDQLSVELFERDAASRESTPIEHLGYIMETATEENPYTFADNHEDLEDDFFQKIDDEDKKTRVPSAKDMYYQSVRKIPLLSREQEIEYARRSRLGDQDARAMLTEANLRLVGYVARYYRTADVSYEDLLGEGNIGLIQAVDRFDERRGCRFCTYAVWYIRREIVKFLADQGRAMALPEKGFFDINAIKKAIDAYAEQNNAQIPTISELSKITGVSKERIFCLIRANTTPLSIDMPSKKENQSFDASLEEIIPDKNAEDPYAAALNKEVFGTVYNALSILSKKERRVMELRFGLLDGQHRTLEEIASEFNMSRQRVSQIEIKAKKKMINSKYRQCLSELRSSQ